MFCHDIVCLTETWLSEFDQPVVFPTHACYSAFRPLSDGPGRHSGGVSVYISHRLHAHVEFVKQAEDASYPWLKLKHVVHGCPEVYFCVCYMPDRKSRFATQLPYEQLQDDVLHFQNMGAQILICGDMNARTAQEPDYICIDALQEYVDVPGGIDELPEHIVPRQNCDKQAPDGRTWGPELLALCCDANLLILNGRTPGDELGQYTFGVGSASGHSVIDYYFSSAKCMSAVQSLRVLKDASCRTDHFHVQLHIACDTIAAAKAGLPPAPSEPGIRYDADKADDDYQELLVAELQKHWLPLFSSKSMWIC